MHWASHRLIDPSTPKIFVGFPKVLPIKFVVGPTNPLSFCGRSN